MADEARGPRGKKWLFALLALVVVLGVTFVAGMWFADRGGRSVAGDVHGRR
jgi:uncharacterized protein YqgC (DUF456 family)